MSIRIRLSFAVALVVATQSTQQHVQAQTDLGRYPLQQMQHHSGFLPSSYGTATWTPPGDLNPPPGPAAGHAGPGQPLQHPAPGQPLQHPAPGQPLQHPAPGQPLHHAVPGQPLHHAVPGQPAPHGSYPLPGQPAPGPAIVPFPTPPLPAAPGCGPGYGGDGYGAVGYGAAGYGAAAPFTTTGWGASALPPVLASQARYWFGGTGMIFMTRSEAENIRLSYDSDRLAVRLLDTADANMHWETGSEVVFGRYLDCGRASVALRYWGLRNANEEANALATQAVGVFDTLLDFTPLEYDNGVTGQEPVGNYFNAAQRHRLQRSFGVQNIELNVTKFFWGQAAAAPLYGCGPGGGGGCGGGACGAGCGTTACGSGSCGIGGTGAYATGAGGVWNQYGSGPAAGAACGPSFRGHGGFGFRFLRLDEGLQLASDRGSTTFGDAPADELFYDIDVVNNLLGLQGSLGFDYLLGSWLAFSAQSKFGLFTNHLRHRQSIGGVGGNAVFNDPTSPYHAQVFGFDRSWNKIAVVAEFDLQADVRLSSCWTGHLGYRMVSVAGAALATEQIPLYFDDQATFRQVDSRGSVLLHGAFMSLDYHR